MTHPKYRPDIDGLRAIAVLAVVGFHAFPLHVKAGFIGVDIFFVISGFLISSIIVRSLERDNFSFVDFYSRRIKRIFPALLLVLTACFIFGWFTLLANEYRQLGKHIVGGSGFISNLVLWRESGYFDSSADTKPLLHLWSLGIEEQFYIVWPLLLWIVWKTRFNILLTTIVVAIVSFSLNIVYVENHPIATFYSPVTRVWELMAGSILAQIKLCKEDTSLIPEFRFMKRLCQLLPGVISDLSPQMLSNACSTLGSILIVTAFFTISKDIFFPGWWAVLPILGTVLIISAGPTAWINRVVLSSRIFVWFGLISFPLYLWHWPLLSFPYIFYEGSPPAYGTRITAIFMAIVLAYLTYKLVENPVRLGNRGNTKTILSIGLMIFVGFLGYIAYSQNGLGFRNVALKNVETIPFNLESNPRTNCIKGIATQFGGGASQMFRKESPTCTAYLAPDSSKTILMWGDSTVGAWLPVFLDISKEKNYSVIVIMYPSCPALIGARSTSFPFPDSHTYCSDGKTQEQVIEWIKFVEPELIVHMNAWNSYSPVSNRRFITDNSDQNATSDTTQRTILNSTPRTFSELEKISKLLVFKSWPYLNSPPIYNIDRGFFGKSDVRQVLVTSEEFENESSFINKVFEQIDLPNTVFFNPAEKICHDKCVHRLGRTMMYHDAYHITPQGSYIYRNEIIGLFETLF